jgi:ABC-2 type transport system ATP-binding protein
MIEVTSLTKWFGGTRAIEDLNFRVERGEIVGFLGPNGAGKTTTMRILAGSLGATQGQARVGGFDVVQEPKKVKQLIGYLPEHPPLYVDMTVRGYLAFCARIKGVVEVSKAVDYVVGRVGLSEVTDRLIGHLSKGYRQRVGLAQALVHSPKVLILDEPASGLDPGQRVEIRALVRELAAGDVTVLLSTHVIPEVEALCSRAIIIDKGRIVTENSVAELSAGCSEVILRLARPAPALLAALSELDGVSTLSELGDGELRLGISKDVREQIAQIAVEGGLLELRSQHALEKVFLDLTRGDT